MIDKIHSYFWGDFDREEIKKFSILSLMFFCMIGSYWLLRTQKDAVFNALVGFEYQPYAKMLSFVASIMVALMYSKLVDLLSKDRLLMVLATFFGGGFLCISLLLAHPTIGFANEIASPSRWLGWAIYVFIELSGTTLVGLFWAFVTSSTNADSAQKGYPIVIAGSQAGSVLGSWFSYQSARFGNQFLFMLGAFGFCLIVPCVFLYNALVSRRMRVGAGSASRSKTGMLEGLRVLISRPYVLGILVLATAYEVVATILEFQMKMLARDVYHTKEAFAAFNGLYGMITNSLALVFALLGTSYLMRRFGLRFCLLVFPVATGIMVGAMWFAPSLAMATAGMIVIKALSYALNNPSKEIMYIPTSHDVRFKAKSWIDSFGGRSSKSIGAVVNTIFSDSMTSLLMYGTLLSLGLIGIWIVVASYVGHRFAYLVKHQEVVE